MTTRAPAVLSDSIACSHWKVAESRMKSCKAIEKSELRAPFTQRHVVCKCEHHNQPHIDPNILTTFWSIAQKSSWECNKRISFPTNWLCDWQRVQHLAPFTIKAFPIQRAQLGLGLDIVNYKTLNLCNNDFEFIKIHQWVICSASLENTIQNLMHNIH